MTSSARAPGIDQVVVGVADYKIVEGTGAALVTYALGSCIAVCVYDPRRKVAGMIHYMLPMSKVSPEKAADKPAMFADTGVPLLFKEIYQRGCRKEDLVVKVAGGGVFNDDKGMFNIGSRNHTVLRKLLWKNNILIAAEDVGGQKSRTVRLFAADGRTVISCQGQEEEL